MPINNISSSSLSPTLNGSIVPTSVAPTNTVITSPTQENVTSEMIKNSTELPPLGLIFLQTQAAQGIAGTFAIASILITCHQVSNIIWAAT